MKQLSLFLFVILLNGCITPFSKQHGRIEGASEISLELNPLNADTTKHGFVSSITDRVVIDRFMDEINNAEEAGQMKGIGWHKIRIWKGDAVWDFYTDGKAFGKNTSGTFYEFKSTDILKDYFHIDTP